jgi:hypothetical protein
MDNERALRIVRGLLAKAESTDSKHEAESLVAKAQELMAEHSIDEQAARERGRTGERPVIVEWEYSTSDSNASGKGQLLIRVALALGVQMVDFNNARYSNLGRVGADGRPVGTASQWCWLIGFENDVARVQLLYASLLVQAALFAREDLGPRPSSRLFTAYLIGFAGRIGQRFEERLPAPDASTALVVHRDAAVNAAMRERFPKLKTTASRGGRDYFGRALGHAAGDRADIGDRRLAPGAAQLR